MNAEQLERLARCFDEEVIAARKYKARHELRFRALPGEGGAYLQVVAGGLIQ